MRALKALKRSPLALDLYAWATHKSYSVARKGKSQFIPWVSLAAQFGSDYASHVDSKRKAKAALRKIEAVYPALKLCDATRGAHCASNQPTGCSAKERPSDSSGKINRPLVCAYG